MALFHYSSSAAGIGAGTEKSLPLRLAVELSKLGIGYIVKEADSAASKEQADKDTVPSGNGGRTARKRAKTQKK